MSVTKGDILRDEITELMGYLPRLDGSLSLYPPTVEMEAEYTGRVP